MVMSSSQKLTLANRVLELAEAAIADGPTLEIFQYVDDVEACLEKLLDKGGSTVGETVQGLVFMPSARRPSPPRSPSRSRFR